MKSGNSKSVAVVGGGFTGLSAAYELARAGHTVTVYEAAAEVGGLAAAFDVGGERLDRFYHHWFTNDLAVMDLIDEVGMTDSVVINPTNTGMYYGNKFFKLSTPFDLLKFTALSFPDRIRLGLLTLKVRKIESWKQLENITAYDWLRSMAGQRVFDVVFKPLLEGKFGPYADKVSAVWMWNKLKLRGSSRGQAGEERLAYLTGGFVRLAERLAAIVEDNGGRVLLNTPVSEVQPDGEGRWQVTTPGGTETYDQVVATPALPLIGEMVKGWAEPGYIEKLNGIDYLSNVCLVLELKRSLSETYWLNVNDPSFPFVAVIEHTNFERAETYGGSHIVYLSKYLPHTDAMYAMDADEALEFSLPYLKEMFPEFGEDWIHKYHLWRERWSQPVVGKSYGSKIPEEAGPEQGLWICSMAQIYPEDRGTNYAIREGRRLGAQLVDRLESAA
ncbi:NAD(P)/FAD-dependent oxidoreductase [Psychromarinibacter sp. S121]|uniref:NAD(P)/FAD-dependent oxidoreductase n=1 Tax=Psychromarinibacter sp. S121 TaxID=3415127 RepID=UPI003C7D3DB4